MAPEESIQDTQESQDVESPTMEVESRKPPTEPAAMAASNKKRPRLDLGLGGPDRKRGKTMFGLLVGTLNKAKIEDKERNASEAAKKRHLIEQRLQNKLRKETDAVRRAEEAKKDKTTANRKEEDLQLKDAIFKYRRTRLPLLANFLITSDDIPKDDSTPQSQPISALPTRSHPPPLYYLPAILTPTQESFLARRKAEVLEAAEKEWNAFRDEREVGVKDIQELRQRVAEDEARRKEEKKQEDEEMEANSAAAAPTSADGGAVEPAMDVDESGGAGDDRTDTAPELDKKDESGSMQADDDEAVEY